MKDYKAFITIVIFIIGGVLGYGKLLAQVDQTSKDIVKIVEEQEEVDDYILEQREINTAQQINFKYMKEMLEKIDKRINEKGVVQ